NEADKYDLVHPPELREALDQRQGEPGVARLQAGLPVPLTGEWVNEFEVDFYWPDLGLVVETDGLRYHRTPAEQARDRLRDQAHTAAGRTPLRCTHEQLRYEREHVLGILARPG